MRDYMTLGPTPSGEDCEQLGPNYNPDKARLECRAYVAQLRRQLGEEPPGARLTVKSNPHDFGSYLEAAVIYDDRDEEAQEYAYRAENETPEYWDEVAKAELGLVSHMSDTTNTTKGA